MTDMDIDRRYRLLTEAARSVSIPTLLVRGGRSDVVTPTAAEEFAALFADASVVDIPGASHMITGDDNSAFLDRATDFLNAL
ncbi:alpha/beta hydrolase [Rhodococcus oxybenzonivorans]|uniref:alpha/beta fold hydrolase n=1 Tax=Rhodococcus oxybenzonivorans TaxID=1990687 RepID=UPI002954E407|nr:alpha/beta hydrolase [Rhodococcus oxybenzonivorans]MDV7353658.1 alpha/beta hydrolase [Rhodococcus oxybenzonivorans]